MVSLMTSTLMPPYLLSLALIIPSTVAAGQTHTTLKQLLGRFRLSMSRPQSIPRDDHVCQVLLTHIPDSNVHSTPSINTGSLLLPPPSAAQANSSSVELDPDTILPDTTRSEFQQLLETYDAVFDPTIPGYNGAMCPFEAVVNMSPVPPQQLKGRLPQYARNNIWSYSISSMNLNPKEYFKDRSSLYYCALSKSFICGPEDKWSVSLYRRLCRRRTLQKAATIPSPRC